MAALTQSEETGKSSMPLKLRNAAFFLSFMRTPNFVSRLMMKKETSPPARRNALGFCKAQ